MAAFSICATVSGCTAEMESEELGETDSAIAATDRSAIQVYVANTKHMSQPGKPSYEGTDITQLLSFMRAQPSLPDVVALSEIGVDGKGFTSQPCDVFVDGLERIVRPNGSTTRWKCIVASGSPSNNRNALGGVAIAYRNRLDPVGPKRLIGLHRWAPGGCKRQDAGDGWTALVQKFQDGARTVAVASVHLPTAGEGNNATGDDCSGKNLDLVRDALAATKADVKIIAGDMNHGDADRRLDGANAIVQSHWETSYAESNDFLNAHFPAKGAYRDPFFRDCAKTAGAEPSPTTRYTPAEMQAIGRCLAQDHWTYNSAGKLNSRIDWLVVAGARSLADARTIKYDDALAAHLARTGKASVPEKAYADHRAMMVRVNY